MSSADPPVSNGLPKIPKFDSVTPENESTHGENTTRPLSGDDSVKRRPLESSSNEENPKRARSDEPDFSETLSRRDHTKKHTSRQKASVYAEEAQEVPAWMKSKIKQDGTNKYDNYGGRKPTASDSARADGSASRYDRYATNSDRYAKYGATPRTTSDTRVVRREPDPEPKRHELIRPEDPEDTEEGVAAYTAIPTIPGSGVGPEYKTFQSKIAHKENKDINSIVRQHYNQRTYQSKLQGSRTKSPIYKMRNFNNAIKYILLGNWVKRRAPQAPLVFLDLCCGKGGDLNKCEFVNVDQYVGIDISDASIREAFSRYSQNKARFIPQNPQSKRNRDSRRYNFEACFATGDLFTYSVPEILEKNFPGIIDGLFPVDAVSIQFSFHYAWETESKVRTILTNITRSLRPGGTFIGTIPSSDFIRGKIQKKEFISERTFGNDLYHVRFEQEPPEDGNFTSPYGNRYDYFLKDAVDDVPEYVVPFETLRLLCEDYGLVLKYKKNFSDIFAQEILKYFSKLNKNLVEGMRRADGKYGVEGDEKEAVAFYIGFVFEKVGA